MVENQKEEHQQNGGQSNGYSVNSLSELTVRFIKHKDTTIISKPQSHQQLINNTSSYSMNQLAQHRKSIQRRKTRKDLSSQLFDCSPHFPGVSQQIKDGHHEEFFDMLQTCQMSITDLHLPGGPNLLHVAAGAGQTDIAREMVRRIRADSTDEKVSQFINYQDRDGWTAMHVAAKEDHIEFVEFLLGMGARCDLEDMGGFTPLMWSCYAGYSDITRLLIKQNPTLVNHYDNYHMNGLIWAAGRGFYQVVDELIKGGAKVDTGDKYGTSPLVWACRRGFLDIVERLLEAKANVNVNGMYCWTPLIVSVKGNHAEVVDKLLAHKPELNVLDPHGLSPLMISAKEGNIDILNALLSAGAHVNLVDKHGDTSLIHAAKAGNVLIVEALLKSAAYVDHLGSDRKTALYWAIDKGHVKVTETILRANPNIDLTTKDGNTCLMKAVRCRNLTIVKLLVDRRPKVHIADKYGDTAFHIAIRSQSKAIVEVLLRNPRNAQFLYQPNKRGETPYQIDQAHQKPILHNLFGSAPSQRKVTEKETQLGYDLYSSAVANLLCEPALKLPICIGLYAKWGSGKSFLIAKLKDDLVSFTQIWSEQFYSISWIITLLLGVFLLLVTTLVYLLTGRDATLSFFAMLAILSILIISIGLFYLGHARYGWTLGDKLRKFISSAKLTLQVCFAHPPALTYEEYSIRPVRFLFTDQHVKISSDHSVNELMALIIKSLSATMESEFGYLPFRLYRVFHPKPCSGGKWRWRRVCCLVPVFYLVVFLVAALLIVVMILAIAGVDLLTEAFTSSPLLTYGLVGVASVIGAWILSSITVPFQILRHIFFDTRFDTREALQREIEHIQASAHCIDSFVGERQSRLVILVDALESIYESERLISFLEAMNALFLTPQQISSHAWAPYVVIMALDPHHHSSGKASEFLKTIVHLPFYLQNAQLRRVKMAQQTCASMLMRGQTADFKSSMTSIVDAVQGTGGGGTSGAAASGPARPTSISRNKSTLREGSTKGRREAGGATLKPAESLVSLAAPFSGSATEAPTKVILTDDYFSDVNPKSIRRIMNIAFIEGRLMKAFNIDFSWSHLTSWVNITEQWPLRVMAMVVGFELYEGKWNDDAIPLKAIYDKVATHLPTSGKVANRDNDEKKLGAFLSYHHNSLTVGDLKIFAPFTINLDPFLRKATQESLAEANLFPRSESASARPSIVPPSSPVHLNRPPSAGLPVLGGGVVTLPLPSGTSPPKNRLAELTVEGVVNTLKSIEGFSMANFEQYAERIRSNNINGKVLSCLSSDDLQDLKSVLGFTFGDWLLFKKIVQDGLPLNTFAAAVPHRQQTPTQQPPPIVAIVPAGGPAGNLLTIPTLDLTGSGDHGDFGGSGSSSRLGHTSSALEKQVTMEETALAMALAGPDSPIEEETNISMDSTGTAGGAEVGVFYLSSGTSRFAHQPSVSFSDNAVDFEALRERYPVDHIIEVDAENDTPPLVSPSKQSVASIVSSGSGSGSSPSKRRPLERHGNVLNESGRQANKPPLSGGSRAQPSTPSQSQPVSSSAAGQSLISGNEEEAK